MMQSGASAGSVPVTHCTPGCWPILSKIVHGLSRAVSCIREAVTRVVTRVEGFLEQPQYDTTRDMLHSILFASMTAFGMASVCNQCSAHPGDPMVLFSINLNGRNQQPPWWE